MLGDAENWSVRRDLLVVAVFVCALFVPFMGKAWSIDEPWFIEVARRILAHPGRPFDFSVLWYGQPTPYSRLNANPPLDFFLLSAAMGVVGESERALRLALLPLDVAAGLALYLLFARFLRRPLLPVLLAVASPAYLVNLDRVMAEKPVLAFGLWGVYAAVRGIDERDGRWFWGSAVLLGLAMLSKYAAISLLAAALGYGLERGQPRRRLALYAAACLSGVAASLIRDQVSGLRAVAATWSFVSSGPAAPWAGLPHKVRSLLCFAGAGAAATALWPFAAIRPRRGQAVALAAAALFLYSPVLDGAPVRLIDRATGVVLGSAALWSLWCAGRILARRRRGWGLWLGWVACAAGVAWLNWMVTTRAVLLALLPLTALLALELEARLDSAALARLQALSLALTAALSVALMIVDGRYVDAQRDFAARVVKEYAGRRVWCASIGGLKYYLDRDGASDIDRSQGGWSRVRAGDVAVLSRLTDALKPDRRILANVRTLRVEEPIPLRLISSWGGEAGFYSNVWGFLPFSISREPLDEFTVVEAL